MSHKKVYTVEAIIFDLDNVLYNEETYALTAYQRIADYLSRKHGLPKEDVYKRLVDGFAEKTGVYNRLFNDVLIHYFGQCDDALLLAILSLYANIKAKISITKEVKSLLLSLRKKYKLGLLTNGIAEVQRNKVRLLKIEKFFDSIVFARDMGPGKEKPNTLPYKFLLNKLRVLPENTLAVEDNPQTDFVGSKMLGMGSVRVLNGQFKNAIIDKKYTDFVINNVVDLLPLLKDIEHTKN